MPYGDFDRPLPIHQCRDILYDNRYPNRKIFMSVNLAADFPFPRRVSQPFLYRWKFLTSRSTVNSASDHAESYRRNIFCTAWRASHPATSLYAWKDCELFRLIDAPSQPYCFPNGLCFRACFIENVTYYYTPLKSVSENFAMITLFSLLSIGRL